MLTRTQGSSGSGPNSSSSIVHQKEAEPITIDGRDYINSVALLVDGKHVVSGGDKGKIRRWRIEDGERVGKSMDAGSAVRNIAVSRDGKFIVGGTTSGLVTVWNAESHSKVNEFMAAHDIWVRAVDISPDGTKISTGSDDCTACIWSLSTGKRLLGPLKHDHWVVAVKFSPDGRLLAAATFSRATDSVRVYDSQKGRLLVEFPVKVNQSSNQSLAWASDSKQLFALSGDGNTHCVDLSTGTTLSTWHIHTSNNPTSIALASNGAFVTTSADSSVSFWDTTTREQIGTVIEYAHNVESMVVSSNYDLVTSGNNKISLQALHGILPSHYFDDVSVST